MVERDLANPPISNTFSNLTGLRGTAKSLEIVCPNGKLLREHSEMRSRTLRFQSPFAAMLSEAHPLQLSITSNALVMVQNPKRAKRKSHTLSLTSLPHASCGGGKSHSGQMCT